jgi:hypothetical protein
MPAVVMMGGVLRTLPFQLGQRARRPPALPGQIVLECRKRAVEEIGVPGATRPHTFARSSQSLSVSPCMSQNAIQPGQLRDLFGGGRWTPGHRVWAGGSDRPRPQKPQPGSSGRQAVGDERRRRIRSQANPVLHGHQGRVPRAPAGVGEPDPGPHRGGELAVRTQRQDRVGDLPLAPGKARAEQPDAEGNGRHRTAIANDVSSLPLNF